LTSAGNDRAHVEGLYRPKPLAEPYTNRRRRHAREENHAMTPVLMTQCSAWHNRLRHVTDRLGPWIAVAQALPLTRSSRLQVDALLGQLEQGIEGLATLLSDCARHGGSTVSPEAVERHLRRLGEVADELDALLRAEANLAGIVQSSADHRAGEWAAA
jgi:hypothetical protein